PAGRRDPARGFPGGRRAARTRGTLLQRDRGDRRRAHRHGHVAPVARARTAADVVGSSGVGWSGRMNCQEAGRTLDAYIDGELDASEAAAVADHAAGCTICRQRLAALESLGRLIRGGPYHAAPDRLRARIATAPRRARIVSSAL